MNESWALKAIQDKSIVLGNTKYDIVRNDKGNCKGCCFSGSECPRKAITICCSGGNILKVAKDLVDTASNE